MSVNVAAGRSIRSEINVTPLIDVVLVLVIVFMVAVPALLRQTPLHLSTAEPGPAAPSPPAATAVKVTADGGVLLNGNPVPIEDLGERARVALRRDPRGLVLFEAEDGASYAMLLRAFDTCRGAGARTLGLRLPPRP